MIAFECGWMRQDRSIPRSDGCILRWDGYLWFLLVNSIFMSFPVCRVDGVDSSGHVTNVTYCLSPDSVTIAHGYDTMREDPNIYIFVDIQHQGTFPTCSYLSLVLLVSLIQLSSLHNTNLFLSTLSLLSKECMTSMCAF